MSKEYNLQEELARFMNTEQRITIYFDSNIILSGHIQGVQEDFIKFKDSLAVKNFCVVPISKILYVRIV